MATPKDIDRLKGTIKRRDRTITSLREEVQDLQTSLGIEKQNREIEQEEVRKIKVALLNFICDGPEFKDKISDIVRDRLDSYHRRSDW